MNQILTYNSTATYETSYTILLLARHSCTYGIATKCFFLRSSPLTKKICVKHNFSFAAIETALLQRKNDAQCRPPDFGILPVSLFILNEFITCKGELGVTQVINFQTC